MLEAITSEGETVDIAAGTRGCDAPRFEQLVATATHESLRAATVLYGAPLLDGLAVAEEAWNAWLAHERNRLHEMAVEAFIALGAFERMSGRRDLALKALQAAVVLNPLREDAHRQIIAELGATGRKAEALKHYQDLVSLLKLELNSEPDADTLAVVAGLRARSVGSALGGLASEAKYKVTNSAVATSHVQALAHEAAATRSLSKSHSPPPITHSLSLIVLPFTSLGGDEQHAYFADAMTEAVTTDLSRISALTVVGTATAGAFRGAVIDIKQTCR